MIEQVISYRESMGTKLDRNRAERIWGREVISAFEKETGIRLQNREDNPLKREKIRIAKEIAQDLYRRPIVKLIGVSGSVAADIMHESDDIDLFIIVHDHSSWIYRIYAKFLLGDRVISYGQEHKKDRICLNFITEERGSSLPNHDIFNFHEIYYMEPIYGADYFPEFLNRNKHWLKDQFHVKISDNHKPSDKKLKDHMLTALFILPNFVAFLLQVLYMIITKHDPDLRRIFASYRSGRVEFYPSDFRNKKLKEFYDNKNEAES